MLYNWAVSLGFKARKCYIPVESSEDRFNVIIDVPPTAGRENAPLTILQAHMDMVAATAASVKPVFEHLVYDREQNTLKSDGTVNIGADDGLGIATIQYIITDKTISHGPLRVIFTLDEEDGMEGAEFLPEKFVSDAKYMINTDWEDAHSVCISCAGGRDYILNRKVETEPAAGEFLSLSVSGLAGGHSGTEIDKGPANAIITLCHAMCAIRENKIPLQIVSINGGSAKNAIPDRCRAVVAVPHGSFSAASNAILKAQEEFHRIHGFENPNARFSVDNYTSIPKLMYTADCTKAILSAVISLKNGVNTMSRECPGLVESSSNLGVIYGDCNTVRLELLNRSMLACISDMQERELSATAGAFGFECLRRSSYPGWAVNPTSALTALAKSAYSRITGGDIKIEPVHAGLECGFFSAKNPELDIISIGATVTDIHTVKETVWLDTLPITVKIVKFILENL